MDSIIKITYVVLHYMLIEQTIQCFESIQKQKSDGDLSIETVIVDNGSPNGSGKKLQEMYTGISRVQVLCLKNNLGFAKGNNAGFVVAKQNGSSFIVLLNNDIIIEDEGFSEKIVHKYQEYKYAVLGPDVYVPREDIHQNPMHGFGYTKKAIRKMLFRARCLKLLNSFGAYEFIKKRIKKTTSEYDNNERTITVEDKYVLHGSALIFSPEYIRKFDGLYEGTFMYYEEQILAYLCHLHKLRMLYSPDLCVMHYHKAATISTKRNVKQRNHFFYKNSIKSLQLYLKLIKEYGEL